MTTKSTAARQATVLGLGFVLVAIGMAALIFAPTAPAEARPLRGDVGSRPTQPGTLPTNDDFRFRPLMVFGGTQGNPCPEDIDGNGAVDVEDLLELLAGWGESGGPADINDDGSVDVEDLLLLLAAWGPCP